MGGPLEVEERAVEVGGGFGIRPFGLAELYRRVCLAQAEGPSDQGPLPAVPPAAPARPCLCHYLRGLGGDREPSPPAAGSSPGKRLMGWRSGPADSPGPLCDHSELAESDTGQSLCGPLAVDEQ